MVPPQWQLVYSIYYSSELSQSAMSWCNFPMVQNDITWFNSSGDWFKKFCGLLSKDDRFQIIYFQATAIEMNGNANG